MRKPPRDVFEKNVAEARRAMGRMAEEARAIDRLTDASHELIRDAREALARAAALLRRNP
jgi:hypothetical protein